MAFENYGYIMAQDVFILLGIISGVLLVLDNVVDTKVMTLR